MKYCRINRASPTKQVYLQGIKITLASGQRFTALDPVQQALEMKLLAAKTSQELKEAVSCACFTLHASNNNTVRWIKLPSLHYGSRYTTVNNWQLMTQSVYNIRTTTQDSFQMLPSICCQRELSEDEEGETHRDEDRHCPLWNPRSEQSVRARKISPYFYYSHAT